MKINKRFIICSIIIILVIFILFLVTYNSLLYNYKNKINGYMDDYYINNNIDDIKEINKVINRYKNSTGKIDSINNIINDNVNSWIYRSYNINYDNIELLDKSTNDLTDRINNLVSNIDKLIIIDSNLIDNLNKLKESKSSYIQAIKYYDMNEFDIAYSYFNQTIKEDNYYEDATIKIDTCIKDYLDFINSKVLELDIINEDTDIMDKESIYISIINYLMDLSSNSKIKLDNSKIYNELVSKYENDLVEVYKNISNGYIVDNKYEDAINVLDDGIKYFTGIKVNVKELTDLRKEYNSMLPISLTTLDISNQEGDWFSHAFGITDNNKVTYARAITYSKECYDNYKTNSLTYNLNKEYVHFYGVIANVYGIDNKNKDQTIIKIYGDDKLLFTSNKFVGSSKEQKFNIDVTNVTNLKIIATITYKNKDTYVEKYDNILIGDPMISRY